MPELDDDFVDQLVDLCEQYDAQTQALRDRIIELMSFAEHQVAARVEVSFETQRLAAELAGVPSDDTWRQWRFDWDGTPGDHTIAVRATTADGEVQSPDPRPVAPDGAEGHHTIRVSVA